MSRAILFDAIFAIVFATMTVTIARFLWALILAVDDSEFRTRWRAKGGELHENLPALHRWYNQLLLPHLCLIDLERPSSLPGSRALRCSTGRHVWR
jgi:hypothetical protein